MGSRLRDGMAGKTLDIFTPNAQRRSRKGSLPTQRSGILGDAVPGRVVLRLETIERLVLPERWQKSVALTSTWALWRRSLESLLVTGSEARDGGKVESLLRPCVLFAHSPKCDDRKECGNRHISPMRLLKKIRTFPKYFFDATQWINWSGEGQTN